MKCNAGLTYIVMFCFLVSLVLGGNSLADEDSTILYVGGEGGGNYTSIQSAIDDASDGDVIYVFSGFYLPFKNVVIDKSISIIGENKNTTIIDGGKTGNVIDLVANWVNISGFTIRNSKINLSYAGIHIANSANVTADDLVISECGMGIKIQDSQFISFQHCEIFNNMEGMNIYNSSDVTLTFCDISTSNNSHGISLTDSSHSLISNCNVSSNNGCGIAMAALSNSTIFLNTFSNNGVYGIGFFQSSEDLISYGNNTIYKNNFAGNKINAYDSDGNYWHSGQYGNYWDNFDEPEEGAYDKNGDNKADVPYSIPGGNNQDGYPLMDPVINEWDIRTKLPIVEVVHPQNIATVKGIVVIYGNALFKDGTVETVEVKIDNGKWHTANGTANWTFEWNTTSLKDGSYVVHVRSTGDDGNYSRVEQLMLNVKNNLEDNNGGSSVPGFGLLLVLVATLLFVLVYKIRN